MQDFNQITSLWKSQNQSPNLVAADKMLSAIKTHVQKLKHKNRLNVWLLACTTLALACVNLFLKFNIATHIGIFLITIAVFTALIQYWQLQKLLVKIDYFQNSTFFSTQVIEHEHKKTALYNRYYWVYLLLLIAGMSCCIFELSKTYSKTSIWILISCSSIWILLCSIWLRKIAVKKVKEESQTLLEKLADFDEK